MFNEKFKKIYYNKIQELLGREIHPSKQQISIILKKKDFELEDIYSLIQASGNAELEKIIDEESIVRRKKKWNNELFLVPPLYVTDRCVNDCLYCPWRRSNPIQRKSLNSNELIQEIDFLIKQGYRTIELVGASDLTFTPQKIAEFISITKERLSEHGGGEVGLNFESASNEAYKLFVKSGLNFMVLWQETYNPKTYRELHPKATRKSDMAYRLNSFDRAICAGLKRVSLAFLGGLYNWKFEVLALFSHAEYLKETYGIDPFIVGTPRWKYAEGQKFIGDNNYTDDNWKFVASIYKLALPNTLPWFSTRENFDLSKEVIRGGGAIFTLDCSTAVGGYTLGDKFSQFPVCSKTISEGTKWLKSLGYKPKLHLPK